MKDEFKKFVRKKPELIKYVNAGKLTWQNIYEQWSLYGEDDSIWNKYNVEDNKKAETLNISSITDMIKKIDVDQVKKGVNSLQKIIELLQSFTLSDNKASSTYEPRQIFKKFED